jgi:hypothetical protein
MEGAPVQRGVVEYAAGVRLAVVVLIFAATSARAQPAPIRVALECEGDARTKACPAFLLGFLDDNKVLKSSPRAGADVIVYATATQIALIDRLQLRFVGKVPGAPEQLEILVDVDTRGTDDEQRAQLLPAFLRGIAVFVGARHPGAVKVELTAPAEMAGTQKEGSPFGIEAIFGGNGSYTGKFQSLNGNFNLLGRYVTEKRRSLIGMFSNAGLNRQPPLVLEDGTRVSLDSERWEVRAGGEYVEVLDRHWSLGAGSFTNFEDDKGQHVYFNRTRAALEWDLFRPNDPRGNRLGVFYALGWATERYQVRNERGEAFATYPVHAIEAFGSVRHDKINFGLSLQSEAQLDHPRRRHSVTVSPFAEIQLGDHIDLAVSLSLTQRELPGPDPAAIDPADFEQQSRLQFAEPLSINGSLNIKIHWDPTNGVRNDRIESI